MTNADQPEERAAATATETEVPAAQPPAEQEPEDQAPAPAPSAEAPATEEPVEPESVAEEPTSDEPAAPIPPVLQPSGFAQSEPQPVNTRKALLVTGIAAVLMFVAAAVFGGLWWFASQDAQLKVIREREAVLTAGQQAVQILSAADYNKVEDTLNGWEATTTGGQLDELKGLHSERAKLLVETKTVVTASIRQTALTELDVAAGKASMITIVDTKTTTTQGGPTPLRARIQAELTKVNGTWKISGLGGVPVGNG
ncbi:hypothetical protein D5S17_30140 [Pseudonocardiaceae bacterium YIM PH 21723]|nr:hypothetical protein D5S17_30140 [Pseudonocardiaceae bacterium YIM PH 21723]